MVNAVAHPAASAPDWSSLESTPSADWNDDRKRLFVSYVEHEKETRKYGAVRRACRKFSVPEPTYYYWVKHLSAENGNGHADVERAAPATIPTPAETIASERAMLVARLRAAYNDADAAAMELKDTLTDALLMTLAARIDELERMHGKIEPTRAVEEPAKQVSTEISALLTPPAPIVETPVPEPAPTERPENTIAAPAPSPMEQRPATTATPAATQPPAATRKAPEKPHVTAKDRAILVMQATLGVASAKYDRMIDLTVEEAMRRYDAVFPNATWTEKNAYERNARDLLTAYDPGRDGHPLHHIERRTIMKHASQDSGGRIARLGREYNPKAFELARRHSKRAGLPKGIDHEFLKTEAYRTMGMLAAMYDEDGFGDFWMWAEPLLEQALDAACGDEAMSFLDVKAKAKANERQKTIGEVLTERALAEQLKVPAKPGDDIRHKQMVTFVNGLATGGAVSTMKEVLEVLLRSYMDDMTVLASSMHDEGVRETLDECLMLLMRSTLKSGWLYDPRRPGNLDDYIRNGWTMALRG